MRRSWNVASALALLLCLPALAAAQSRTYVVAAPQWGSAQAAAVAAAGGTVVFSNDDAGVAVVSSASPAFLSKVRGSAAVTDAALDRLVQWTRPLVGGRVTADFTNPPNDAIFFNTVQWAPQAVDAPAAWAKGCTGQGVRVAIIDGGIDSTHPDLAPNLDVARSASFVPGLPFNFDSDPDFWHGTHVAGIVAAADNAFGVVGIAPKATLVGVKALDAGSGTFGAVIEAILYAATPTWRGGAGADIINMSLGAVVSRSDPDARQLIVAMAQAVNFARRRGVLVVASAGNDAIDLDANPDLVVVPAESGAALAVSATGPEGFALGGTDFSTPASYTNIGRSIIDVAAPGGDFRLYGTPDGDATCVVPVNGGAIGAPCWAYDMVFSTNVGGWAWAAGTSMSAPATSAVAAIIKQRHPFMSAGELAKEVQRSAIDLGRRGHDKFYGDGWVNALAACEGHRFDHGNDGDHHNDHWWDKWR